MRYVRVPVVVACPDAAGTGLEDQHLGVTVDVRARTQRVFVRLAEKLRECNLSGRIERLTAEHEHQVIVIRIDDGPRRFVAQPLREIHARHLGAERAAQPTYLHHRGSPRGLRRAIVGSAGKCAMPDAAGPAPRARVRAVARTGHFGNACRHRWSPSITSARWSPAMTSSSRKSGIKLNRPFVGIPSFLRAPDRDGSRRPRRRHRGLRSPLRRRLALPRGLAHGSAIDPPALAAIRVGGPRALRPGDGENLPLLRDGQPDHRRRRRRRRMAHRREELVRQRDRSHQGGPRQGGDAGGARGRPLRHLPDREGVRGRGAAARHPLRRPHRLLAVHPRSPLHQRPCVPPHHPDGARAEPRPGRNSQPPKRRVGHPGCGRRRQPSRHDGPSFTNRGPGESPKESRAMRGRT